MESELRREQKIHSDLIYFNIMITDIASHDHITPQKYYFIKAVAVYTFLTKNPRRGISNSQRVSILRGMTINRKFSMLYPNPRNNKVFQNNMYNGRRHNTRKQSSEVNAVRLRANTNSLLNKGTCP